MQITKYLQRHLFRKEHIVNIKYLPLEMNDFMHPSSCNSEVFKGESISIRNGRRSVWIRKWERYLWLNKSIISKKIITITSEP